uniref:Uncharacterized protein n=1 Tax=Pristionchus pacificus TaxID=54126 RepID=A0A2A6CWR9_PRIPA|eukprot:PDM82609.1 hypothetical protein PRIPAC_37002 [Pristionchus pacificus]
MANKKDNHTQCFYNTTANPSSVPQDYRNPLTEHNVSDLVVARQHIVVHYEKNNYLTADLLLVRYLEGEALVENGRKCARFDGSLPLLELLAGLDEP